VEQFHPAYYTSRKYYGLYAGLLIATELFGIRIVSKKPFGDIDIELISYTALPAVLIALMGYYAFRYTIEWKQADEKRRGQKVSIWDFRVSHGIAVAAILFYIIQRLSEVQLIPAETGEISARALIRDVMIFPMSVLLFVFSFFPILHGHRKNNWSYFNGQYPNKLIRIAHIVLVIAILPLLVSTFIATFASYAIAWLVSIFL